MDDQGERTPASAYDVQFHGVLIAPSWFLRQAVSASESPDTALRQHVPSGPGCVCTLELSPGRMTAYERTAA